MPRVLPQNARDQEQFCLNLAKQGNQQAIVVSNASCLLRIIASLLLEHKLLDLAKASTCLSKEATCICNLHLNYIQITAGRRYALVSECKREEF